jgi:hypothetical protein
VGEEGDGCKFPLLRALAELWFARDTERAGDGKIWRNVSDGWSPSSRRSVGPLLRSKRAHALLSLPPTAS